MPFPTIYMDVAANDHEGVPKTTRVKVINVSLANQSFKLDVNKIDNNDIRDFFENYIKFIKSAGTIYLQTSEQAKTHDKNLHVSLRGNHNTIEIFVGAYIPHVNNFYEFLKISLLGKATNAYASKSKDDLNELLRLVCGLRSHLEISYQETDLEKAKKSIFITEKADPVVINNLLKAAINAISNKIKELDTENQEITSSSIKSPSLKK